MLKRFTIIFLLCLLTILMICFCSCDANDKIVESNVSNNEMQKDNESSILQNNNGNNNNSDNNENNIVNTSQSIDLNQYVKYAFLGYSGVGKIELNFDYESFLNDNKNLFNYDQGSISETQLLKNDIVRSISIDVDFDNSTILEPNLGFSNGDIIVIKWNVYPSDVEKYGVSLKYNILTITVSTLTERQDIDLFQNMTLALNGKSPCGIARIDNYDIPFVPYSVKLDKQFGLSNGDVVTATFKLDKHDLTETEIKEFFYSRGYNVAPLSKEFVVSGLETYVLCNDIPQSIIDNIFNYFKSDIELKGEQNNLTIRNFELIEMVSLTRTDQIYKNDSYLYFVFRLEISGIGENGEKFTQEIYKYALFTDIVYDENNAIEMDPANASLPSASSFFGSILGEGFISHGILFTGFETYENFYAGCINQKADVFNYTLTVKQFEE